MSLTEQLIEKGVRIENPASIEIGPEVDIDRISGDGVVIYAGCKILGEDTLILRGSKIGYESPVTVDNCQIGPDVELKGGFFQKASPLVWHLKVPQSLHGVESAWRQCLP